MSKEDLLDPNEEGICAMERMLREDKLAHESRIFNGHEYGRDKRRDKFFYATGKYLNYPSIVCECGSSTFTLNYGEYELIATCTACGNKESVYSG